MLLHLRPTWQRLGAGLLELSGFLIAVCSACRAVVQPAVTPEMVAEVELLANSAGLLGTDACRLAFCPHPTRTPGKPSPPRGNGLRAVGQTLGTPPVLAADFHQTMGRAFGAALCSAWVSLACSGVAPLFVCHQHCDQPLLNLQNLGLQKEHWGGVELRNLGHLRCSVCHPICPLFALAVQLSDLACIYFFLSGVRPDPPDGGFCCAQTYYFW